jgi:PadR family transcriptional regulator PadR
MKRTKAALQVASVLLEEPTGRHWGYRLSRSANVRSGVLYPILARMLDAGWLLDGWEDPTLIDDGRPPRRYYEVTDEGLLQLDLFLNPSRQSSPPMTGCRDE